MVTQQEKFKSSKPKLEAIVNQEAMYLAASWYIAMPSKKLGKKPIAVELFGRSLIAWRDENGHPAIMERYCSHLGADLAVGQVVDGCIRCPYHHWRYNSSGQCVSALEVEHIPPTAGQATYVTVERYGYIWVWYGSYTPLFPLPEFSVAETQKRKYMTFRYACDTKTTVQRLVEANACDYYHAIALHNLKMSAPAQFTILDDRHLIEQNEPPIQKEACLRVSPKFSFDQGLLGPIAQALGLNARTMSFITEIWSSGYRTTGFADDRETLKVLFGATPISKNRTIGHFLMLVRKTGKFWLDIPYHLLYNLQSRSISAEDMSVLNTIKSDAGGAYVQQDRGILEYRKLHQRWVDKVE